MARRSELHRPKVDAKRALELLGEPAFIADLTAIFVARRVLQAGGDPPSHLTPQQFFEKYGILPRGSDYDSVMSLNQPEDPDREAAAILGGRWGIIRVFPWTTDAEVREARKGLRQAFRRVGATEHQDQDRLRSRQATWLWQCRYSNVQIAKAVWGRQRGLRRPTRAQAVRRVDGERETALMQRYAKPGRSYREQERLTVRRLRGSEASAGGMVRQAIARERKRRAGARAARAAPAALEPVAAALTTLLTKVHPLEGSLAGLGHVPEIDALRRATLGLPKA